jgi:hypothetical protein
LPTNGVAASFLWSSAPPWYTEFVASTADVNPNSRIPRNATTFVNTAAYDRAVYVRREKVNFTRTAQAAITAAASLAALLLTAPTALAQPAEPGAADNAAADNDRSRNDQPAQDSNCPMCDLVKAAQQLPPPDLSGWNIPPLVDVSVPVGLGVGLPSPVPAIAFPINLGAPQLPPPPDLTQLPAPQLPPPPSLPSWQPTWCGPGVPGFTPCI